MTVPDKRRAVCEVCIDSVEGALVADRAGADRIELCGNLLQGGTTPSLGLIQAVRTATRLPLMVMIRPRGGDFCYSPAECDVMLRDIQHAAAAGADGVVFGALTPDGQIDRATCQKLQRQADKLSITFHRAFDWVASPHEALQQLIDLKIDRVLTSGCAATAEEGIPLLKALVRQAGTQLVVMPGAGVRVSNVRQILQQTGAREIHFTGSEGIGSPVRFRRHEVPMSATTVPDDYRRRVTSFAQVQAICHAAW